MIKAFLEKQRITASGDDLPKKTLTTPKGKKLFNSQFMHYFKRHVA